ncbi:hypothetical protein [Microbacter margulisiae]|uniref:Uncharacterized protein n=1 Tax=Microbacter margulisiae TaxID=1350067 RepID=A0A7W5DRP8_9PORP|nr:hypothetical protein [Microbacter margulisiae]MBB3187842.1 hypothetical protein [Microbacter margulisiae]
MRNLQKGWFCVKIVYKWSKTVTIRLKFVTEFIPHLMEKEQNRLFFIYFNHTKTEKTAYTHSMAE